MANFNSAKYIKFAIESVLKQTYKNWELIIYDDASKDNYLKVIENFTHDPRIKIFKNKQNEGCGSTKAKAINKASGDLIGIIDSDDALKFDALEIMMEAHKKYFDYGLIYSNYYECNYDLSVSNINKWVGKVKNNSSDIFKARVSHFLTFKKDIYKKISGIDPELRIAEDKDLIYKFEEVSKIRYIDQPLYYYRLRKKSATYGKNSWMADGYCALAKYKAYKRRLGTEVLNFSLPQIADILLIGATKFIISGEFKRAKILFMKSYKFKKVNFLGYCKIIKSFLQEIKHQLWLIKIKFYKKWFSKALLSDGPDIKSEKLISDNYKFIYIAVPKSATRSMMNVFYWEPRYNFFCSLHNGETSEIVAKRNYSKYFKFGFVRNPWSRVVSCFLDKIKKANQDKKKYILNRYPELNLKMSFEEFVFFYATRTAVAINMGIDIGFLNINF